MEIGLCLLIIVVLLVAAGGFALAGAITGQVD